MCTWYPTDLQRNWKELVGGSPVGKRVCYFRGWFQWFQRAHLQSTPHRSAGKGGGRGVEGFLLFT